MCFQPVLKYCSCFTERGMEPQIWSAFHEVTQQVKGKIGTRTHTLAARCCSNHERGHCISPPLARGRFTNNTRKKTIQQHCKNSYFTKIERYIRFTKCSSPRHFRVWRRQVKVSFWVFALKWQLVHFFMVPGEEHLFHVHIYSHINENIMIRFYKTGWLINLYVKLPPLTPNRLRTACSDKEIQAWDLNLFLWKLFLTAHGHCCDLTV